jgi:hypothetical protein
MNWFQNIASYAVNYHEEIFFSIDKRQLVTEKNLQTIPPMIFYNQEILQSGVFP